MKALSHTEELASSAHLMGKIDPTPPRRGWVAGTARDTHNMAPTGCTRLLARRYGQALKRVHVMRRIPWADQPAALAEQRGEAAVAGLLTGHFDASSA